MQPLYNIPIIPQNLRREETIVQTVDALKHLTTVTNDIFSRVNKRIQDNSANLAAISNRIEAARLKVEQLTGAKKATQVFSSSKYPALDIHRPYNTIFDKQHNVVLSRSKYKYKALQVNDEPLDTLQFYHVKVEDDKQGQVVDGLGDVPQDITAVNDLLLYNTGKNPYASYIISDPLSTSSRLKREEIGNTSSIGAPPHSLIQRATMIKSTPDLYFYSPDLGNVPTIDVPLDLPDLPGIADDLRYIDQVGTGIAPSVTTTPLMPDLPPLVPDTIDVTPELPTVPFTTSEIIPDLQEIPQEVDVIPDVETVPVETVPVETRTDSILPAVTDAHASLMEAIRKAAGTTSSNKVKQREPKAQAVTGDLMADLHAKLSLRRKGISGLKNSEPDTVSPNLGSNTTMQKISAMIPPPPVEQSDSTNTEDEEWDE